MKKVLLIFFLLLVPIFIFCQKVKINENLKTIDLKVGDAVFSVELALNNSQREIGLMNRKSLKLNSGMLFVFSKDKKMNFWMKDTLIPLSIAYVSSDGTIEEIYNMKPKSLDTTNSNRFVRYALEVNLGDFERNNVKVGDKIDLSLVPKSLD